MAPVVPPLAVPPWGAEIDNSSRITRLIDELKAEATRAQSLDALCELVDASSDDELGLLCTLMREHDGLTVARVVRCT